MGNISLEVQKIRNKWISQGWPRFVSNIHINGIHAFKDQQIEFKFPVCAIVGENGTGKSTILKILACAYRDPAGQKTLYPSDFFPDTAWDKLKDVKVTYQLKQGTETIFKKITKPYQRWLGITERSTNNVYYFDINRIQSIETLIGYSKLGKKTIKETASRALSQESIDKISEVMARKYLGGRYAKTSIDESKEIGILKFSIGDISKFHQGTGESITFDMIASLEKIPDYSLVVIDEIESSLHPKAQRRLIRQLLNIARVKTLQIVFSTHSPYILEEVPPEARILLARVKDGNEIIYAPSVEFCLSQIDDYIHSELDILVEDKEAKGMVSEILRAYDTDLLARIRILPVGSADVIKMLEELYCKGKIPIKILGIVDGDQPNMKPTLSLPGQFSPEKQVIKDLSDKKVFDKIAPLLNMSDEMIKKEFEEVQTILNPSEWISKLAKKFNISATTLWDYLVFVWVRNCLIEEDAKKFIETVSTRLKTNNQSEFQQ